MGSVIDEFEKDIGGNWLNAENVKIGALYLIEKVERDYETWAPKKYLICFVKGVTKESEAEDELRARIGPEAYYDVKQILGMPSEWTGSYLKPLKTKYYPGVKATGIIWSAEKAAAPPTPPAKPAEPAAQAAPPTTTPETTTWLKYNELIIGAVIDPADWSSMPPNVKKELKALRWITYDAGYPVLSNDARTALK